MLRNIWKTRELLFCLVRRDLIVRYQSSVLGFFWSFAKPLALVVIFFVAFGIIIPIGKTGEHAPPFALHLLVGILVWSFLARSVSEGHWSVLSHSNLIKKIKLPVEVFPAVTVSGNLINFALGMVVVYPIVLIVMSRTQGFALTRVGLQLLALAGLTVILAALAFSLTLVVSALNVFYRDVESLSEVALQAWFYATPIIYPMSLFYTSGFFGGGRAPRWVEFLYWCNPMTPICVAFRRVLLYWSPPTGQGLPFNGLEVSDAQLFTYLGISVALIVVLYLTAQTIFRHYARSFADEV